MAWTALQKLLLRGKSESGLERNCAFLNLSGSTDASRERFATVSASTSLDFPDDARGLAICDWDYDGRIDFWITNRTAPRVRLMLNRYETTNTHWLSLRLQGDGKTVNRDAVGARIEVFTTGNPVPLLRTVAAGNGFLSQSSAWQHVGLGSREKLEKVVVRWPGGGVETFDGAAADGFYQMVQGTGTAKKWTPPLVDKVKIKPPPPVPASPEAVRLALLVPLPLAESLLPAPVGEKGLIVNLWSADCLNCKAELKGWAAKATEWHRSGVSVASWCVDATKSAAEKLAKSLGFTLPVFGSELRPELTGVLNALQMSCFGLQADMPVPTTFLLDAKRRVVAIYKGPVKAEQLSADFELLAMGSIKRRQAASPDKEGQWHDPIAGIGLRGAISMLLENGYNSEAEKMLEAAILTYNEPLPADAISADTNWNRQEFAEAQRLLANWDLERKDYAKAEKRYLIALQAMPTLATRRDLVKLYSGLKDPRLYPNLATQLEAIVQADPEPKDQARLGVLKLEMGKPQEALDLLAASLKREPDATNWFQLAQAHKATGDKAAARNAWQKAIEINPTFVPALNNLAWQLATSKEPELRDVKKALEVATAASEHSKAKNHIIQATLAAAQAENGDWAQASKTAHAAKQLAEEAKDAQWAKILTAWVENFAKQTAVDY